MKRVYVQYLPTEKIHTNPFEIRLKYDEAELKELTESILAQDGAINPITVRRKDGFYEVASGGRRVRAYQRLGEKYIPAIVREFTDEDMIKHGVIENLHRKNLNPIEEAKSFAVLKNRFNIVQDHVAFEVRKTHEYVGQRLRLLSFPAWIQEFVSRETMSVSVAEAIASASPEIQSRLLSMIQSGWEPTVKSVREFAQASMQPEKSTHTDKPTGELKKTSQTIAERVADTIKTQEDSFRIPCRICGRMIHFSSRSSNWESKVKGVLYRAFSNWKHVQCPGT